MSDIWAGFTSLFADFNKPKTGPKDDKREGPISSYLPELTAKTDDATLIANKKIWERDWSAGSKDLEKRQKQVERYWLGKVNPLKAAESEEKPSPDNLIFQTTEEFIAKGTQKNPDPVVTGDGTPEGNKSADLVRKQLLYLADNHNVNLKMTLRKAARYDVLYFLGAVKVLWSEKLNDITIASVRPQKLILDPEATIENGRYTGKYLGEYRSDTATDLLRKFPGKKEFIDKVSLEKPGTKLGYIEWWYRGEEDLVFWTLKDEVLDKIKNPHWNYGTSNPALDEMGQPILGADGQPTLNNVPGKNHFEEPEFPYSFISVLNLGSQPFDVTNGIYQCLSLQDIIEKRWKQIDRNTDAMNNGLAVSGEYFSKAQAAEAADARAKGNPIWVPRGDVNRAMTTLQATALPSDVHDNLLDARNRIPSIVGTSGTTPSMLLKERTVRGKSMARASDDDRMSGGFSEYLEQCADRVYNLMTQFIYVYYDEPHSASIVGKEKAREYFTLQSSMLTSKIQVSVKEGSMIPQDPVSRKNQAIEEWGAGATDPISFFEAMDDPNPRERAKLLFLWKSNPAALFPDLQQPAPAMSGAPPPQVAPDETGLPPPTSETPTVNLPKA